MEAYSKLFYPTAISLHKFNHKSDFQMKTVQQCEKYDERAAETRHYSDHQRNDTVTVNRLKFGDNDTLSAKVAGLIDADLLTILSDIDGLYDANPRKRRTPHSSRK
ncbi:hypothetical protein PO124_18665 [Bacillus licheniformis]|nr:hypothetical protein [Bacillus licheniformis]